MPLCSQLRCHLAGVISGIRCNLSGQHCVITEPLHRNFLLIFYSFSGQNQAIRAKREACECVCVFVCRGGCDWMWPWISQINYAYWLNLQCFGVAVVDLSICPVWERSHHHCSKSKMRMQQVGEHLYKTNVSGYEIICATEWTISQQFL